MTQHHTAFTWISATGAEVRDFFQSQFTADIHAINIGESRFTGYCQPKGRLIATLLVAFLEKHDHEERWALVLPEALAEETLKRLQKFIMRRKVQLTFTKKYVLTSPTKGVNPNTSNFIDGGKYWLATDDAPTNINTESNLSNQADINSGRVWIVPATQELFVPQMIGLERHEGVSFSKGCYPGQEVVARMHYLGKPKRGLYRAHIITNQLNTLIGAKALREDAKECGILVSVTEFGSALLVLSHEDARRCTHLLVCDGSTLPLSELTVFDVAE